MIRSVSVATVEPLNKGYFGDNNKTLPHPLQCSQRQVCQDGGRQSQGVVSALCSLKLKTCSQTEDIRLVVNIATKCTVLAMYIHKALAIVGAQLPYANNTSV